MFQVYVLLVAKGKVYLIHFIIYPRLDIQGDSKHVQSAAAYHSLGVEDENLALYAMHFAHEI